MQELIISRVVHASVLIDFGGETILTDPWFSERPGYYRGEPLGVSLPDLPRLAGIAVSHNHYDHYDMETFQAYPDKEVPFAVKRGTAEQARKAGFTRITELDPWESTMLGSVKVTAAPAKHSVPQNTYILEANGFTVYFGGDTLLIPELTEIAQRFPHIDVALLPINGLMIRPLLNRKIVMNAQDAAALCAILCPRIAVPIHYTFTGGPISDRILLKYNGTPKEFTLAVAQRAPETSARVLKPGEPLALAAMEVASLVR